MGEGKHTQARHEIVTWESTHAVIEGVAAQIAPAHNQSRRSVASHLFIRVSTLKQ